MSRWRSIWLVARREVLERGRSRGFILSMVFTTLIVAGSFILPTVLFGEEEATRIGVVQPEPPGLGLAITTTAAQLDQDVEIVPLADVGAGEAGLADDSIAAAVNVPADLADPGSIRFAEEPDSFVTQLVTAAVVALRTQAVLTEAGVSQGDLLAAQQAPAVDALDPRPTPTARASCSRTSAPFLSSSASSASASRC